MMERAVPVLPADDLRVAKAFYVDRLGFRVRYESTDDGITGVLGLEHGGFVLPVDAPMEGHGRHVVGPPALARLRNYQSS